MTRLSILVGFLIAGSVAGEACAQDAAQAVGGKVVDVRDGHPIANATVTLQRTKAREKTLTATTDGEGRFHFDAVPAGKYTLGGQAHRYLFTRYLQHEQFGTAIVTGAGLATEDLVLPLNPMGRIAGTIMDEAGEPVRNASVTLYRGDPTGSPGESASHQQRVTREDGTYEFDRLAAGRYFVAATATPWYALYPEPQPAAGYTAKPNPQLNVAYPMLFYPASLDASGAEPLEIKAGEQITANLQFQPVPALTVSIHERPNQGDVRVWPELTRSVFGSEERVQAQVNLRPDGTMRLVGVPPGQYHLQENSGGQLLEGRDLDLSSQSVTLEPAAAADSSSIEVQVHAVAGESLSKELEINLTDARGRRESSLRLAGDDKGTMTGVTAGDYRVSVAGDGRQWNVAGLTIDGRPVADRKVHVTGRRTLKAELTLSNFSAEIDGVAKRHGEPDAGALLLLVPAGGDDDLTLFRRDQSDLDGSFSFYRVLPGKYLVVAIDDGWPLKWSDRKALAPYLKSAAEIEVPGSGKATIKLAEAVEAVAR